METILLHGISPEEFFEKLRSIIREELKQELQKDQLLTRCIVPTEGGLGLG